MKILLTGSTGMVGKNILHHQYASNYEILSPKRKDLNLLDALNVQEYIISNNPDMVIHAAGVVGGIQANMAKPVKFLVDNMQMGLNILMASKAYGVKMFMNLGSSCMYPKDREILHEDDLLTGKLEPTNEGYAIAKVSAALLCKYICAQHKLLYKTIVPTNLYGPYDNFDPVSSHLIPAIISKLHDAKTQQKNQVEIWGDGKARREFMYVDDASDAIIFLLQNYSDEKVINNNVINIYFTSLCW